ncbi:trypsin-like peptidase domain-containing protein [Rhodohalobacter sp. SW132]|nr:trypsin-like peptidase domain-containing protein [Rhodohalobacter sp. SW132]
MILIGILIGMIVMFLRQDMSAVDLTEVRFTEVNRSDVPVWTNEDLEKIDDRFVFRSVARNVTPTVVYIETIVPTRNQNFRGEGEEEEDSSIWRRFMPPRAQTVGSGVLISSDGYILTNNHVVEDAIRDGITVTLEDKRSFESRVVGRDPSTDLAVIKIDGSGLPHATIGNSDYLEVGEWVMAIGNPFRLQSTVTAGIVSALGREVDIINDLLRIESFIQTDAAINRGNSGGALVNTSGELIGINTAIATQSGSYQGYGFAVPSNLAMKVATDIIEHGAVRRGMLGVQIRSVDSNLVRSTGLDRIRGVYVSDVDNSGAAGIAGLRASDVILGVNDQQVNASNQLQEKVAMFRPGDSITLTVWRNGETIEIKAELKELERPEPEPEELSQNNQQQIEPRDEPYYEERPAPGDNSGISFHLFEPFGLTVQGLSSPQDPDQFDFYIEEISPDSPAHRRGVPVGSQIVEINGEELTGSDQMEQLFSRAVRNQTSVQLKIKTEQGSVGYYNLTP